MINEQSVEDIMEYDLQIILLTDAKLYDDDIHRHKTKISMETKLETMLHH